MNRKLILPAIAAGMLTFALWHNLSRQKPVTAQEPLVPPAVSPFMEGIAGAGLVESRSENISIGSELSGVVGKVHVIVGQQVSSGEPLFALDTRQLESDVRAAQAKVRHVEADLERLKQLPRPEDIPAIEALRKAAEATLAEAQDDDNRTNRLLREKAVTESEVIRSQQRLAGARAQLERTVAEERKLKAGAWQAEIAVASAAVDLARAELDQMTTQLARRRVMAPDAPANSPARRYEVLQVKVRPGEYVGTTPGQTLIVLGDAGKRHVRVDIDEHDIHRFHPKAQAVGRVRGNSQIDYKLEFVRVEPFVIPKRSLTGDNTERIDTRVLQVIYAIEDTEKPLYVGQQMDVFCDLTAAP